MMPELSALSEYLYQHIPLSRAMQVEIERAEPNKVVLRAPLAPNINHRDTVFGGSASAVAILAAWTLLYLRLQREGLSARVVIQRNTMQYLHAIPSDFEALAEFKDEQGWQRFLHILQRKRRARIHVVSELLCANQIVGEMAGDFVALLG